MLYTQHVQMFTNRIHLQSHMRYLILVPINLERRIKHRKPSVWYFWASRYLSVRWPKTLTFWNPPLIWPLLSITVNNDELNFSERDFPQDFLRKLTIIRQVLLTLPRRKNRNTLFLLFGASCLKTGKATIPKTNTKLYFVLLIFV